MEKRYKEQVALLIDILPYIAREKCFALKGGTAINLFLKDMPRLSVDIDLTYIKFDERQKAYANINKAIANIINNLKNAGYNVEFKGNKEEKKIICSNGTATIKIEPNYVIRGFAYEPKVLSTGKNVENTFGYTEIQVISKSELYGGKICAALDRQHPRDLFDIRELLEANELDSEIIKGFIIMLLSHDKPLHEVLSPNIKDQKDLWAREFMGMTDKNFTYDNHMQTLKTLINAVITDVNNSYKDFLLDFVRLQHNFSDVDIPNLDKLPAIMWKVKNLENLRSTNKSKFDEQFKKLEECFEI